MPLKPIVTFILFLLIYIGNHGGSYYANHILIELGIALSVGLFGLLSWFGLFSMDQRTWKKWVYSGFGLALLIMLGWATVFGVRFGQNILFSFFASREYFYILLCPCIYLAWANGLDVITIRRTVWFAVFILMLNYLFFYNTMDLEAAFFSSNPKLSSLITLDDWRGFRLKPPLFAIMIGILMSVMMIISAPSGLHVIASIVVLSTGIYIWTIVQFRSTLATMILSSLAYPFITFSFKRLPFFWGCIPLMIIAVYGLITFLSSGDGASADGADVRAKAFERAFNSIAADPLFGAGQASSYSLSYEQIMGPKFFPDDIGLVGMTYKYGFIGISIYLFMHFYILVKLWNTNWKYREIIGKHEPLIWGTFIWMCAQTMNLVLNPGLSSAKGITMAGIGIALCGIYRTMLFSGELMRRREQLRIF